MRPTRATALLTAGLVTLLGVPAATAAETPTTLYVNNATEANCSDAGPGSQAAPFCTISAAAKIVEPGQTVRISHTKYPEDVVINRSGEPGKPITFTGDVEPRSYEAILDKSLTISGASHVVVSRVRTNGGVKIDHSADVVMERSDFNKGFVVGGGSTDVRVSQSGVDSPRIEGGAQRTVFSRNYIDGGPGTGVVVVDAPGTTFTNNTFDGDCKTRLSFMGGSTGSSVFNNVFFPMVLQTCSVEALRNTLEVEQSATAGTRADYNLFVQRSVPQAPYIWAGTGYKDPAAFQAATGQGGHDITAPFTGDYSADDVGAVDSGDPTAPGVLPVDYDGNPTADDPRVPNTGKDGGYIDRGAREFQDSLYSVKASVSDSWLPTGTKLTAHADTNSNWADALTYRFDFGDGSAPVVSKKADAEHVYSAPCACEVKVTVTNGVGKEVSDRKPVKVTPAGPLTAVIDAKPVLPTTPTDYVRPLTVDVDPASLSAMPWPISHMELDFGDGTIVTDEGARPVARRNTYKAPGDYLVTLRLVDTHGGSSVVSKTVKVDYAPSGYVATEPFRLMDTRTTNTPARGGQPVTVRMPVDYAVPGHVLSGGMAAAVLNVTVTDSTEDTHLTVWPYGQPRPTTSNVNVTRGGTAANTVTVPLGAAGSVNVQLNSGKASLIVDFVGYYQPNAGERFGPLDPTRLVDTRVQGGALGAGQTRTVKVAGVNGIPADATAVALNLTSTGATGQAHVIAYPDPAKRPTTSNLNVEPGKDKSNQAIVPVGPNGEITLYTNSGSTHLVLDAVGYYGKDGKALFTPVVPKRLADTRTTGKVSPGATTTVSGIPGNAVGAVLNLTATESTGPGFLTAYGFDAARPEASSLNSQTGGTVPNHVTTPVGNGQVSIFNSWGGSNHVIADLFGYFTAN